VTVKRLEKKKGASRKAYEPIRNPDETAGRSESLNQSGGGEKKLKGARKHRRCRNLPRLREDVVIARGKIRISRRETSNQAVLSKR